jgi:cytochrome c oxidase subunit 2
MNVPLLLAASGPPSMFEPASPQAESVRALSVLVFAISGFIFFVVEAVLIYCLLTFRRRPVQAGSPQPVAREPGAPEPPQVYGSKPIEIAWTAAPALFVFVLVLVTVRTLWDPEGSNRPHPPPKPDDNALYVRVIGRQWWWEYSYDYFNGDELGFVTANELHVPAGTPAVVEDGVEKKPAVTHRVYLTLQSADVCHSFWVPRLAGKTDLIPGRDNRMVFFTDRPGLYVGQCAEYCGTQHANMLLRVYVESPDDFKDWLRNQKKVVGPGHPAYSHPGRAIFEAQSCVNCHRIAGTSARGVYAPDLTHLMSRETLAAGLIPNDPEGKNLSAWIEDPQRLPPRGKEGCLMPAFGLGAKDREAIVEYLKLLK